MPNPTERGESTIIAELNDLLQLDHDAVEAYTVAIDMLRDDRYREILVMYRADHKRHIEELARLVRARNAMPIELPHATGPLKLAIQAVGALGTDRGLLLAFKAVEGQAHDKYARFSLRSYPPDVADVVTRGAVDEEKHYRWVERTLAALGVGEGTLPHGLASAVESVHKLIADPLERAERAIMRRFGEALGQAKGQPKGGQAPPSV